jgi:hypothetical protein
MPTVDDALALAALGWEVISLNGKVPLTPNGVKDATTDPDKIRKMFGNRVCNIGARVPANWIVLDKDPRNGGSWEALEALAGTGLPQTLTVATGSDGGEHRYYIRPEGKLTSRNLPPGIDLKTSNGYCVMPGSIHLVTGKTYAWMIRQRPDALPPQIVALLVEPTKRINLEAIPHRPSKRGLTALVEWVRDSAEGTRNDNLFWALCASIRDGYTELDRELILKAGLDVGLPMHEVIETHQSALNTEQRASA